MCVCVLDYNHLQILASPLIPALPSTTRGDAPVPQLIRIVNRVGYAGPFTNGRRLIYAYHVIRACRCTMNIGFRPSPHRSGMYERQLNDDGNIRRTSRKRNVKYITAKPRRVCADSH